MYEEQRDGLKKYNEEDELETKWSDIQNISSTSTRSAITQRDILSNYFATEGQDLIFSMNTFIENNT